MEIQDQVRQVLDDAVAGGAERGVQVAAYHRGRLIVDAWGGVARAGQPELVDGETLFPVFSTTKGIAATVIHQLVERGKVSYDTRVAEVWPEFGAHDKASITLRHCMTHTAGLPNVPSGIGLAELHDWDAICAAVAGMEPAWPPGSRQEYHALTYGWLLGELARRVEGRPFSTLVQDEICRPLGIDSLFVGLPAALEARVATLEEPDWQAPVEDGTPQAVPGWMGPLALMMNQPAARRACQPASNGIMNARAIARHYAALLPGGVDGVELLPPGRVHEAATFQPAPGEAPLRMGLGYMLGGEGSPMGDEQSFGHGGYGGSLGFADPSTGLAFGFTRNLFTAADTLTKIVDAIRQSL